MSGPLPRLIGICGKARHGKGEVAKMLEGLDYRDVQFSAPVKELFLHIDPLLNTNPVDGELGEDRWSRPSELMRESRFSKTWTLDDVKSLPDARQGLQSIGNGAREIIHPDVWVDGFRFRYGEEILAGTARLVVSDMRYPNEAALIREFGGEVWKVERFVPNEDGILEPFDNGLGALQQNASETSVDLIDPDLTILNDGSLADLRLKLRQYFVRRSFS